MTYLPRTDWPYDRPESLYPVRSVRAADRVRSRYCWLRNRVSSRMIGKTLASSDLECVESYCSRTRLIEQ
jgi:hypothetical protein